MQKCMYSYRIQEQMEIVESDVQNLKLALGELNIKFHHLVQPGLLLNGIDY